MPQSPSGYTVTQSSLVNCTYKKNDRLVKIFKFRKTNTTFLLVDDISNYSCG